MEIDSKLGLMGLADAEGFAYIDAEIEAWIDQGTYDDAVQERAEDLGIGTPVHEKFIQHIQYIHRRIHPTGPFGWEFCSRCETAMKNTI